MTRLRFVNPYSAARAGAVVGLGFTGIIEIPAAILRVAGIFRLSQGVSAIANGMMSSLIVIIVVPLLIFVSLVICCRLYNWYADKFGGIEVDLW
jgi:hypothetical protein